MYRAISGKIQPFVVKLTIPNRLKVIQLISDLIFIENKPEMANLIIVPGSSHSQLPLEAVSLYKKGFTKKIIFTGGFNPKINKSECDFGKEIALKNNIPEEDILCETKSTNTLENAIESQKLIEEKGLKHNIIIIICKTYHAQRLKMTFSRYFLKSKLLFVSTIDERKITKTNWWKSKEKADVVMDELRKIGEYTIKGDLNLYS